MLLVTLHVKSGKSRDRKGKIYIKTKVKTICFEAETYNIKALVEIFPHPVCIRF